MREAGLTGMKFMSKKGCLLVFRGCQREGNGMHTGYIPLEQLLACNDTVEGNLNTRIILLYTLLQLIVTKNSD